MNKLSLTIVVALLFSPNLQAESTNLSGKIRFIGQITAPSCEIVTNSRQNSKLNFSNCKIGNLQNNKAIQKVNVTIQQKEIATKNIIQWTVAYK